MKKLLYFFRVMRHQRKEFYIALSLLIVVNAIIAWLTYGTITWVISTILVSASLLALVMFLIVNYG